MVSTQRGVSLLDIPRLKVLEYRERKNENQPTPVVMYMSRILANTVQHTLYRRNSFQSFSPFSRILALVKFIFEILPMAKFTFRIFQILRRVKAYLLSSMSADGFHQRPC